MRVASRTIHDFGAVHILVNNAGRGMRLVQSAD
jgi:NAD(P)-dependent dehydrogenase (short-subunit alcohol dehydrogenase family)